MEKQRLRSAAKSSLPMASTIPDPETFRRVVELLKEGVALKVKASELEEREKEIKEELAAVAEGYQTKGFRHALAGFEYHGWQTKKTLSKEKLLSNGVSADVIDKSFSESDPFLSTKMFAFDLE